MSNSSDHTSNSNHLSFNCHSGELLWGQLHCICEGYFNRLHNRYDFPQSIPKPLEGGTILQRSYQYRCRAVKGEWQAKFYRTRLTLESEPFNSGYIIYHTGHNPAEILRRCVAVGKSLHQSHDDHSIIYINRYDWSSYHHYQFESEINQLLRIDQNNPNDENPLTRCFSGRVMIMDSDSAMNIIQQMQSNPFQVDQVPEKVLIHSDNTADSCDSDESNNRIGLHLSVPNGEYEFAWLVFNSDQPNSELIAIVYDGRYTLLEGQILLDQEDVVTWNEYELKRSERARLDAEHWKKLQSDAEEQDDIDIRMIMNNRGNKTVDQMADEFIAQGFTFGGDTGIISNYDGDYSDFQSIVDTIRKKLAESTDSKKLS